MSARIKSRPVLLALSILASLLFFDACRNRPASVEHEAELAGEPDEYSATVTATLYDAEKEPVELSRSSIFRSGDLYREEWSQEGERRALIWRPDTGKSYLLSLDRGIYIESAVGHGAASAESNGRVGREAGEAASALEAGEIESAFEAAPSSEETRRLPDEEIDGHPCTVFERRAVFESGQVEVTTTFRAKDLRGLALKIVSETDSASRRVKVIIHRDNVRATVNPDLFTVPLGFKKVDRLFR